MKSRLPHNYSKNKYSYLSFEFGRMPRKITKYEHKQKPSSVGIYLGILAGTMFGGGLSELRFNSINTGMAAVSASEPRVESNASESAQIQQATISAEVITPKIVVEESNEKYSWVTETKSKPTTDNQKEVIRLINEIWGEDAKLGRQLAFCESTWGSANTNLSSARGVFQFIKGTWIDERKRMGADTNLDLRFDIKENIKTGYSHFKRNGLNQPWAESVRCVKNGSHK